jgi:hypothetical protein
MPERPSPRRANLWGLLASPGSDSGLTESAEPASPWCGEPHDRRGIVYVCVCFDDFEARAITHPTNWLVAVERAEHVRGQSSTQTRPPPGRAADFQAATNGVDAVDQAAKA